MVINSAGHIKPGIVNLNIKNCEIFPNKSIFSHRLAYMTFEMRSDEPNLKCMNEIVVFPFECDFWNL